MRNTDIKSGATYAAAGKREYFVEGTRTTPAGTVVDYTILAGPEQGERLTCGLREFARRAIRRLPDNQSIAAKGGL
jgi:hypothetical protein